MTHIHSSKPLEWLIYCPWHIDSLSDSYVVRHIHGSWHIYIVRFSICTPWVTHILSVIYMVRDTCILVLLDSVILWGRLWYRLTYMNRSWLIYMVRDTYILSVFLYVLLEWLMYCPFRTAPDTKDNVKRINSSWFAAPNTKGWITHIHSRNTHVDDTYRARDSYIHSSWLISIVRGSYI